MMGRWTRKCGHRLAAPIVALSCLAAAVPAVGQSGAAHDSATSPDAAAAATSNARAGERFRAAAALANRELYDLAANEWAALIADFPDNPLVPRARIERGDCLFRLGDFAAARAEFQQALAHIEPLDDDVAERCYAHLGLVEYNLGGMAQGDQAAASFAATVAALDQQLRRFPDGPLAAESAFYRAEALYALGRHDEAIEAYQSLSSKYPQHPRRDDVLYALGVAQQEKGDLASAAHSFSRFLDAFPDDEQAADAQLRRGEVLLALGNPADAEACFAAVASDSPNQELAPRAAYLAASAALQAGDLQSAAAHAATYHERFPASDLAADVGEVAAEVKLQQEAYADAAQAFERLLTDYPQHARRTAWTVRQAHCLLLDERCGESIRILDPTWREISDVQLRAEAALVLGTSYLELGRADDAANALTAAAALPSWSQADDALLALARAEHAQGKMPAAIETLDRLIAQHPDSRLLDRAVALRGELHAATQSPAEALLDFERLLAEWPDSQLVPQVLLAEARVHFGRHDWAAAETALDRVLTSYRIEEVALDAMLLRAAARHERGDFRGGIADADAAVATDPPRPKRSDALYTRGLCEMGLGQPAAAADTFQRIVHKDPQYHALDRVLYDLAWAYQEAHDAKQATATFAKLVASYPDSPLAADSWYQLGEAQYAAHEYSAAAKSFWSAGQRATTAELTEKSLHKLAWSCFEQGQFEAAEEAFAKQASDFPRGKHVADAAIMTGECRFQRREFAEALAAFDAGLRQESSTAAVRELALLHAGQAAAQLNQWQRSLELLDACAGEFPRGAWIEQVRYERGWALYRLGRLEEAQPLFETVAANHPDVLGARARFMAGEVQFARRQYDDAVRTFFQVAYGYGDANAPESYHRWQAEALFEAARCLEETKRIESARKLYRELLERFPTSEKAAYARSSLEETLRR